VKFPPLTPSPPHLLIPVICSIKKVKWYYLTYLSKEAEEAEVVANPN
jgi:hypothetical protein